MKRFKILQIFYIICYMLQGLMLNNLTLQCTAAASTSTQEERIVFVSSNNGIYLSKGPDYNFSRLPFSVGSPGGIDFDGDLGVLFWTDTSAEAIKRTGIDDSVYATVLTSAGTNPEGIAVDGGQGLIFWSNHGLVTPVTLNPWSNQGAYRTYRYNARRIERITYDGKDRTEVVSDISSQYFIPITLFEKTRTLYWSDGSYLRSCTYDGRDKKTIISSGYNKPDLALNAYGHQLFWCERSYVKTFDITRRAEGSSTVEDLSSTCTGVTWFEDDLYWTNGDRYLSVRGLETNIVRKIPVSSTSLATKDISVGRRKVPGLDGGDCDFERFTCNWAFRNSMSNNLNWTRLAGQQAANSSLSVGPLTDHTHQTPTGHFMFLNTSSRANSPGNIATLVSPLVNVSGSGTKCFRFWYYMHDVTNGSLTVFFQNDLNQTWSSANGPSKTKLIPLWSTYGSQPDEWIGAEMDVRGSGVGRILIKAIVGDPRLNAIAIDDVHFGECRQDSRLVCEDTSMTVYLDKARLGLSSQDGVSFKNSLCQGSEYDSQTVAIRTPYNGCGTAVTESDATIVFSNQVNVMIHSDIRTSDVSIRVNCSLSRTYHVAMTYLAHSWIRYIRKDGYGNFSVGIRQYTNVTFEEAYPSETFPQQVEIDDKIYMATEMVTIKNVVDTIKNARCWATPSQDPSDPVSRDIIRNGCPVGDSTKVYTLLTRGLQAFSFKAFSFSHDRNLIYVHCDVIVCHESSESACSSNCSRSRAVRETRHTRDETTDPYTVSQGPFIYKMSSARREDGSSVNIILLSALVCTIALLLATIFVAVYIYTRFRNGGIRHD